MAKFFWRLLVAYCVDNICVVIYGKNEDRRQIEAAMRKMTKKMKDLDAQVISVSASANAARQGLRL